MLLGSRALAGAYSAVAVVARSVSNDAVRADHRAWTLAAHRDMLARLDLNRAVRRLLSRVGATDCAPSLGVNLNSAHRGSVWPSRLAVVAVAGNQKQAQGNNSHPPTVPQQDSSTESRRRGE